MRNQKIACTALDSDYDNSQRKVNIALRCVLYFAKAASNSSHDQSATHKKSRHHDEGGIYIYANGLLFCLSGVLFVTD